MNTTLSPPALTNSCMSELRCTEWVWHLFLRFSESSFKETDLRAGFVALQIAWCGILHWERLYSEVGVISCEGVKHVKWPSIPHWKNGRLCKKVIMTHIEAYCWVETSSGSSTYDRSKGGTGLGLDVSELTHICKIIDSADDEAGVDVILRVLTRS